MKAKNRKTGEVVDIISYSQLSAAERCSGQDYVSYIDSQGVEHCKEDLNYYWDFEPIDGMQGEDIHWQDVRERAAIAAMQGLLANSVLIGEYVTALRPKICVVETAVEHANMLVEELKKKQHDTRTETDNRW